MNIKNTIIILLCATVCTLASCTTPTSAPLEQSCTVSNEEIALKLTIAAMDNDIITYPVTKDWSDPLKSVTYNDAKSSNTNDAKIIAAFYQEILKGIENSK